MFDKFGEFNSAEELNRAAAAQKEKGDREALILLAEENGIDREDAEDYMDGLTDELATPAMAALGKIKVESADLKLHGVLMDWADELKAECAESPGLARAVRWKGKGLDGYMALLANDGFLNRAAVDKRIVEKCGRELKKIVGKHEFYIGVPDKYTRRQLMEQYYLGEKVKK